MHSLASFENLSEISEQSQDEKWAFDVDKVIHSCEWENSKKISPCFSKDYNDESFVTLSFLPLEVKTLQRNGQKKRIKAL